MTPVALDRLHAEVAATLAEAGHRYTAGRRCLVEVLARAQRPLRLPEIESLAPEVPRSSAYRNLVALERCGVVKRFAAGGERAYFELAESLLGHHHHAICEGCGLIDDIRLEDKVESDLDQTLSVAVAETGFSLSRHNLDIYGRCAECVD